MKYTNIFKSLFLLAGLAVATGVSGGNFSKTYTYAALKSMAGGKYSDASSYLKVPSTAGNTATITIPASDFSNQPNEDITLTFHIATFGPGNNPSVGNTTISAKGNESGSNWSGASVSGQFPKDGDTYKDVVLKISKPTSPTTLAGLTISIKVNSGVKILRLKKISMEYSYEDETPCNSTKVAITKGASPNGSFTLSTDEVCPDGAGGTVFVTGITPADGYQFKEIRTSASGDVDNTNKKVSGIKAATTITVMFSKIASTSDIEVVEVTKDNGIVIEYDINANATITISQHEEKHEGKTAEELFFSKYFEAAANVKLIAIYNGTDHEIDITEYSYQDVSHNTTPVKFKNFAIDGKTTPNPWKIKRGEEIIFITYTSTDKEIIQRAKDNPKSGFDKYLKLTTPEIRFNGDDVVKLFNANDELIDIIGAANGAPSSTTSYYVSVSDGNDKKGFMDKPGGWYTTQGTKIEVNGQPEQAGYALSTNRCLLIRKKDVVSGAIAVAKNTDAFYTLGDTVVGGVTIKGEWKGFQIPGPSSGAGSTNSGTGFEAVGSYDYAKYYDTWIPVPAEVLGGGQNPDGTVTIKVNDLEQRACKTLKIELKDNGGNVVSEKEYDVPIIIKTDHSTKDEIFNQMKDTCKTCDVVILDNATLTKENDANKHWGDSARKVDIYAGGKLVVPAGKTYYAEDIIVRTHGTKESWLLDAPEIVLNNGSKIMIPNSTISPAIGQRVRIETSPDNDLTYYMVSFPYHVVLADVTYSDESPATFNTDFFIYKYDGERRANSQTASGNWVPFTGTMLEPGIGYLVAAKERSGHTYRELLFPMVDPGLNQNDAEPVTKPVGVNAWGWTDDIRPNHKGWNFVSNPYLRGYQNSQLATDAGGKMSIGFLEQHEDGYWYISETEPKVEYITVLDADGKDYHQEKVSLTNLPAFQPFFVQIGTGDMGSGADAQIEFKAANRVAAAPGRRMTAERPSVSSLGLLIEGAEAIDNCGIVIGEQYSPAYELMADLSKEFGSAYSLKAYTLQDGDNMRLAFHAIHPDRLTNTIPVGVRMPATAEYTFRIDKRYDLSDFEHVWLHDAETGEYTDLLYNDYTFNGTKQQNDSRFKLTVSLRPKTPTDVDHVLSGIFVNGRDGALMISGLPEEASVYVYDLNGRLLVSDHTQRLNTAIYPLSTGVYQVRVEGNGQNALLKAIVK